MFAPPLRGALFEAVDAMDLLAWWVRASRIGCDLRDEEEAGGAAVVAPVAFILVNVNVSSKTGSCSGCGRVVETVVEEAKRSAPTGLALSGQETV